MSSAHSHHQHRQLFSESVTTTLQISQTQFSNPIMSHFSRSIKPSDPTWSSTSLCCAVFDLIWYRILDPPILRSLRSSSLHAPPCLPR
ncbi:hypothetical protein POPTR_008G068500v4 [Populus trichocarpa]|uniref:Uncharacterized protein n=1 Tax=Populus trichocarpa TaxID=3694 RepID=A0ACC0SK44_POPTR|nr:hypothetical protein POPTR_008G068500v4 [Populus trichocarpa]